MTLLESGGEGRVDADAVRGHLSAALALLEISNFLTEGLYRHTLDHGLQPTADRLIAEVIRRNLDENRRQQEQDAEGS